MYILLDYPCSMLSIHIYNSELELTLTLPPLELPGRMLEVIRTKVALYHWPEVDVQYTRISRIACALGPLQVNRARADGQVVLDFWSCACKATSQSTLSSESVCATSCYV
jgi:hypothetical protein